MGIGVTTDLTQDRNSVETGSQANTKKKLRYNSES